jgi:hypothetical protein
VPCQVHTLCKGGGGYRKHVHALKAGQRSGSLEVGVAQDGQGHRGLAHELAGVNALRALIGVRWAGRAVAAPAPDQAWPGVHLLSGLLVRAVVVLCAHAH